MVDDNGNIVAEGGVCVWDPGELSLTGMMSALSAINKGNLFPNRSNKKPSLRDAVLDFGRTAVKPKRGHPLQAFALAEGICGFDVKQMCPESDHVDPVDVVTVIADQDDKVQVVSHNPAILPKLEEHRDRVTLWIQRKFDERREVLHSSTVTAVVNRLMASLRSTPIKRTGGCYWIPDSHLGDITTFCDSLSGETTSFQIAVWRSTVAANQANFKAIADSIKAQMEDRLEKVANEVAQVDKRQNENGKASRTAECYAVMDLANEYSAFLGSEVETYKQMAEKLKDEVNMAAAFDFCT
jgi:hypothetical protein